MSTLVKKQLSVFDSICIIVGIIIGAGIYETAPAVAAAMGSPQGMFTIWIVGGLLALAGSVCYGELASTFPQTGGDVVYLGKAYGRWAGFLFGWSQMMMIRPGDIALMAFIFARYASRIVPFTAGGMVYALTPVMILTVLNMLGVRHGKWTQNVLAVIKMSALVMIVVVGMVAPKKAMMTEPPLPSLGGFELALILVMFTYGGWNEIGYVAAEVKHPDRNIIRALLIGVVSVTVLYCLTNAAFLAALGDEAMTTSQAVAADTIKAVFPEAAGRIVSVLICLSCLGAINGLILTGARISYAIGTDNRLFRHLGQWHDTRATPVHALLLQGLLSCAIILLARSFIDTILYTAPLVWLFFLATGLSVFVLRKKASNLTRPYKVTGYPLVPLIYCAACVFMLYSCTVFAFRNKPVGLMVLICLLMIGMFLWPFTKGKEKSE